MGDDVRAELGDRIYNIKGRGVREGGRRILEKKRVSNLAIDKTISIRNEYSYQYAGSGDKTLVNGVLGSPDYTDREWLGFEGTDFEAVIDLGEEMTIHQITCNFLINQKSWIFSPEKVEISISLDGEKYTLVKSFGTDARRKDPNREIRAIKVDIPNSSARFIRITATNIGHCPDWHPGAGGKSWLFVDEIIVE
jgi:hypothetical protein